MHLGVTTGLFCKQNLNNYRMWVSRRVTKIAMDVFSAPTFLKLSSALIGSAFWAGWMGIGWAIGEIQAAFTQRMRTVMMQACSRTVLQIMLTKQLLLPRKDTLYSQRKRNFNSAMWVFWSILYCPIPTILNKKNAKPGSTTTHPTHPSIRDASLHIFLLSFFSCYAKQLRKNLITASYNTPYLLLHPLSFCLSVFLSFCLSCAAG